MTTPVPDIDRFGKAVRKLALQWEAHGYADHAERRDAYLREREDVYQRMCASYIALGQTPPPPTVLSGIR